MSVKEYRRDFVQYDLRESVYKRPDTYIGSDAKIPREELVYDFFEEKLIQKEIDLPEGIENLFIELLTNATDNVLRSKEEDIKYQNIEITLSPNFVEVKNNGGLTIPIEEIETNKGFKGYKPELIFGVLLTTSHADKEEKNNNKKFVKVEAGRNGYGTKLCNVFSKKFEIEIGDHIRNKKYYQCWENQLTKKHEPNIKKYSRKTPFVRVRHYFDFERFGYEKYPLDAMELFVSRIIGSSYTCGCKMMINLIDFETYGFEEDYKNRLKFYNISLPIYSKLIGSDCEKIFYYDNDEDRIVTYSNTKKLSSKNGICPIEVCVMDTPEEGNIYSFVNGIYTKEGGVHVDEVIEKIPKQILNTINDTSKRNFRITSIKPHITIIVSCHLNNPRFSSQYKSKLTHPNITIDIPKTRLKFLKNWSFSKELTDKVKMNDLKELKKTDGKKTRFVNVKNAEDANFAGDKSKSKDTILFIVEGLSAKGLVVKLISMLKGGRDYHGCFPLKGKPINAMKATKNALCKNNEVIAIKKLVGLKENVDYSDKEKLKSLRYGKIVVVADADDDGKHITGLLLNLFSQYDSLLEVDYIYYMMTPILISKKGNKIERFYTKKEYEIFLESQNKNSTNQKLKYVKGLGSLKDEDIKHESRKPKYVLFNNDEKYYETLQKVFSDGKGKTKTEERKKWLSDDREIKQLLNKDQSGLSISISDFLNTEMKLYSYTSIKRTIPNIMDGFKESQRKCLWGSMLKWKPTINKKFTDNDEYKVAQLSSLVAAKTHYAHGENSLNETITKMAQNYIGSNNMNIFQPNGQFGTRTHNGKDASQPRYIFVLPEWWWSYVYKEEDKDVLQLIEDEGYVCEPKTFYPIIPMILINGVEGIATGWSTKIPCHDVIEICQWYRRRLLSDEKSSGEQLKNIKPKYNNFFGEIQVTGFDCQCDDCNFDILRKRKIDDLILNNDVNHSQQKINYYGKYHFDEKDNLIVTEIPIGKSINDFLDLLKKLMNQTEIKKYVNLSTEERPYFKISGLQNKDKNFILDKFKLTSSRNLSNMNVLFNDKKTPITINTIPKMLEVFYKIRLKKYKQRKNNLLRKYNQELNINKEKIKFINLVIDNELVIFNRPKVDILNDMEKFKLNKELLSTSKITMFTKDKVDKLQNIIKEYQSIISDLQSKHYKNFWYDDIIMFEDLYLENIQSKINNLKKDIKNCKPNEIKYKEILNTEINFKKQEYKRLEKIVNS